MNMKTKKLLAVLLSAIMVVSAAFVSTAETQKYEKPELNREDIVETTGKWKKDKNGDGRLETESGRAKDGWYYANKPDSPAEFGWYHFDETGNMSTGWIKDEKEGIWYYTGETKDGTEGSLVTGWITDPQDGKKYYLDPATGVMSSGWKKIGSKMYYFGEGQYADVPWTKNAKGHWIAGKGKHSFGTMYANEFTPDGQWVGPNGALKQSNGGGSSGGGSSGGGSHAVFGAEASTSTAQYAGQPFNTNGLKITVYKNGEPHATVILPDERRIPSERIRVKVNGIENGTLILGPNTIEIQFVYYDGGMILGQAITTSLTIESKLHMIPEGSIYDMDRGEDKSWYSQYTFYDESGNELTDWKEKDTPDEVLNSLKSARRYKVSGSNKDRFYMYAPGGEAQDMEKTYYWTYYTDGKYKEEYLGTDPEGNGKGYTRLILKTKPEYIQSATGPTEEQKPTVWYWIDTLNKKTKPLGYDDWFIPSRRELSPLNSKFSDIKLWSSSEVGAGAVWTKKYETVSKAWSPVYVIAVRSF